MLKSLTNYVPPFLILLLVCYLYYSYVIHFCLDTLESVVKRIIYLVVKHIFLFLFLWSFAQSMFKNHAPIPDEYKLSQSEHARLLDYSDSEINEILKKIIELRKLEIYTTTATGTVRYCKTCKIIKPDRCHHCSSCEKCILKMDHHCPWVGNCVGFSNYKEFFLMIFYGTVACGFYVATVSEYISILWNNFQTNVSKLYLGIGFVVALFFGVLVSVLLFYHMVLISKNETTLEALYDVTFIQPDLTFNLGTWNNFIQVFGENVCYWLIPVKSGKGNGHEFQVNHLN